MNSIPSRLSLCVAACGLVFAPLSVLAELAPDVKCESTKLKSAGKYGICRLQAEAKAVRKALPAADVTKCDRQFSKKWADSESSAAGACPTNGDEADLESTIVAHTDYVTFVLTGVTTTTTTTTTTLGPRCGDGVIEGGEECEFGDLDGASCQTEGFLYGTVACAAECVLDVGACTDTRFVDTGSTVMDRETELEWEKKTAGNVGDTFAWSDAFVYAHGSSGDAVTAPSTGAQGIGGATDWRVPTHLELQTIVDCSSGAPCIDSIFGDTASTRYWTSTTNSGLSTAAWYVDFGGGGVLNDNKTSPLRVRAVRGGL